MVIDSCPVSLILVWCCAACNAGERNQQTVADTAAPAPPQTVNVALPNEKTDSISIEGMWQPITLRLIKPASSLPFVTYVPSDMIAETVSSDEGEAHYFYANFGGRRNDDAFLLMFIFPPGTKQEDAVRLARAFKSSRAPPGFVVNVNLRARGQRFYYIAEQYPSEYGDGFGPRAQKIQDQWLWLDAMP